MLTHSRVCFLEALQWIVLTNCDKKLTINVVHCWGWNKKKILIGRVDFEMETLQRKTCDWYCGVIRYLNIAEGAAGSAEVVSVNGN